MLEQRAGTETTVIVTVTVLPSTVPASPSYTNSTDFEQDVLNQTNYYRHKYNASDLIWNDTLATHARQWAQPCNWKHSGGPYGENLAEGYANVTAAVDAWGDESAKYNFLEPTGFSEQTGHFTQLVWKATTDVGCGVADCPADNANNEGRRAVGWFLVCEYWPVGNVEGDDNEYFKENVDRSISQAHGFKEKKGLGACLTLTLGVILIHLL
ncbi:hypothetical protein UA08_02434 [Talaromyces atroroseus]|uniref:SCP domain-containing protein n=1 Tax=Talaromyces atroroseus TaxID=1441469 RepID=A0A225B780_TALAT|nr:hypothetical protein UA08_02434 [Talaromyces atroroseus]OKL61777.1 hypothetical protein UA08_02434 [Talaromyces atroroseus]